jgi:hypothetical protein
MMRREGLLSARGLAAAFVLGAIGLLIAWLCVRTTMIALLPAGTPALAGIAPGSPAITLGRAATALEKKPGLLGGPHRGFDPATLASVRRAAVDAPLDARPFLILGYQHLSEGKVARATRSLEAAQRLNPRNRLVHVLLLERYLLTNRFTDAAAQLSVLSRLVGAAQSPIATAMAQMLLDPMTSDAARRTLRTDATLERGVLIALAKGSTEPDDIFVLAGPAALADAGSEGSWGQILVTRLVRDNRFAAARNVWQRIHRLPAADVAVPIFNPSFAPVQASAPFNWTLTAGGLGAADPRAGTLSIDYYGRDSGDLARQLLVLAPGRYRFTSTATGGKPDAASRLFWTVTCAGEGGAVLTNMAVPTAPGTRRAESAFTVPAGCPAQTLVLRGEAGEFPAPITLDIGNVAIRALTENNQ